MTEPTAGQLALIIVAIAFFVIGGLISLLRISFDKPWSRLAAKACMYMGVVISLGVLVWHSIARGNWLPLEDNFDTLIWLALVLSIFVMYVQRRKPLVGLDWFIMPVVVLLLVGAAIAGKTIPREYDPKNLWLWIHLVGVFGGAVAFAVAGAAGAMYLLANYRLRQKLSMSGPNLGSLERLEHLATISVTLGFAMLTVGMVTGFVEIKFGKDPMPVTKVILASAAWAVYAVVLHAPAITPSFRGRRAAVLSIVGFALMVVTVVAAVLLPSRI